MKFYEKGISVLLRGVRKAKPAVAMLLAMVMVLFVMPTTVFAVEEIHHANITIAKPVGGENPSFDAVSSDPQKYYADVDSWGWMYGSTVTPMGGGSEFKVHNRYDLRVIFRPKLGYRFAEDCVFTFNGETTGCYGLDGIEFRYTYWYAADPQKPTYTVSFDSDGGSGTMAAVPGVFDEYVLPSCTFTPPAGQYFYGWFDGRYIRQAGDMIHVLSDITISATWRDIPSSGYTVSFDPNGGGGTMASITDFYGEYTLPECGFTPPAGKRFDSWMTDGDGVLRAPGTKINVTGNTSVAPIWDQIPETSNTVFFADVSIPAPVAGETSQAGIIATTGKYDVSIGWSTTKDGSVPNDFNNKTFEAGKTYYLDLYLVTKDPYVFSEDTTVYVNDVAYPTVWTVGASYKKYVSVYDIPFTVPNATYTVSFNANGGTGTMAAIDKLSGDYTLPACSFTAPNGKRFKAWRVGGAEKAVGDTITVNANTTVTAVWEDIPVTTYTVSFNANGGTGTMADKSGQLGKFVIPKCKFTPPSGMQFKCWAAGSAGGEQYAEGEEYNVTGNVTFYAIWKDAPVDITITATAGANGTISPSGTVTVTKGGSQAFTIAAKSGYHIKDVKVNGKSVGRVSVYSFTNVTANGTITVEFEADTGPHVCHLTLVPKVEPDCTNPGKSAYYHCECGKDFEDEQGKTEITDSESWGILLTLGHEAKADWLSNQNSHWKECARCDGQQLEKGGHTDNDNDSKCDVCSHQMTPRAPEAESEPQPVPEPGADDPGTDASTPSVDVKKDSANLLWLWIILAVVVAAGGGFALYWFVLKKNKI